MPPHTGRSRGGEPTAGSRRARHPSLPVDVNGDGHRDLAAASTAENASDGAVWLPRGIASPPRRPRPSARRPCRLPSRTPCSAASCADRSVPSGWAARSENSGRPDACPGTRHRRGPARRALVRAFTRLSGRVRTPGGARATAAGYSETLRSSALRTRSFQRPYRASSGLPMIHSPGR
ncbi:FG-GAP repeat protein [Streptomyces sp. NPDC057438]|uniref:FG-GAP repeat protein n=1 Tax=Streptomyces sp. NPDC057438 TaxID=3346133 RepID=UPI0036D0FB76